MSILRTAYALRTMSGVVAKRNLAILPTVKKATDTSEMDFPAPSHVSLTSDAAALAHELASFYSDPGMYSHLPRLSSFSMANVYRSSKRQYELDCV